MKTIRLLDLFAGTQSFRKAAFKLYGVTAYGLNEHNIWVGFGKNGIKIEYAGFDIYSPEKENIIFDLTQDDIVRKLEKKLPLNWIPDFIWASPVCNTFSRVNPGKGGNYYFIHNKDDNTIKIRDKDFGIGVSRNFKNTLKWTTDAHKIQINTNAPVALKMYSNMKKIIKHFNAPFAIENPATALSQYILKEYIKNDCAYCMYGDDRKKPTAIYSNKDLNLLKCSHKGKHQRTHNDIFKYSDRAKVPHQLIIKIIKELL